MGKIHLEPLAQGIAQTPVIRLLEAVLRTFTVAGKEIPALQALRRESVALGKAETDAFFGGVYLLESMFFDVAKQVLRIHEVIAGIHIAVVLHHERIAAGLGHGAHPGLHAAPEGEGRVEHLDIIVSDIPAHPLVEHVAKKSPVALGRYAPGSKGSTRCLRRDYKRPAIVCLHDSVLHGGKELPIMTPYEISEKTVDLRPTIIAEFIHHTQSIELHPAASEHPDGLHHPVEGRLAHPVAPESIVDIFRSVQRKSDQKSV